MTVRAPYHPASNGRLVQSFKQALKAGRSGGRPLSHRLGNFLLTYRTTPHSTTGKSPSQLFLQRDIRTHFDLLEPDCEKEVLDKQGTQKSSHDKRAKKREWFVGQRVMVRNVRPGPDWILGTILEASDLPGGDGRQTWKHHADQLKRFEQQPKQSSETEQDSETEFPIIPSEAEAESDNVNESPDRVNLPTVHEQPEVTRRYPQRDRRPPERFGD